MASTVPSARTVRLCCRRPVSIGAVGATSGAAPLRSIVSAEAVEGPPPATKILPMS